MNFYTNVGDTLIREKNQTPSYDFIMLWFFTEAHNMIFNSIKIPSSKSPEVGNYLSSTHKNKLSETFKTIISVIEKASKASSNEAISIFKLIFGDPFPSGV